MKSFLTLFLCFSFIGFPETSQAAERAEKVMEAFLIKFAQGESGSCKKGDLDACNRLLDLEIERDNLEYSGSDNAWKIREAILRKVEQEEDTKLCDGGDLDACNRLWDLEVAISFEKSHIGFYGCSLLESKDTWNPAIEIGDQYNAIVPVSSFKRVCNGRSINISAGNNFRRAELFARVGCSVGNLDECNNLGILEYERGNLDEAAGFFKIACNERSDQNTPGCSNLRLWEENKKVLQAKNERDRISCYYLENIEACYRFSRQL